MVRQCQHIYWPEPVKHRFKKMRMKPILVYVLILLALPVLWMFWVATGGDM
jgi:hypothetical protein